MGRSTELEILSRGVEAWNEWRASNATIRPSLLQADLIDRDLSGANFSETDLSGSNLEATNLTHADVSDANLVGVNLAEADMSGLTFGVPTSARRTSRGGCVRERAVHPRRSGSGLLGEAETLDR